MLFTPLALLRTSSICGISYSSLAVFIITLCFYLIHIMWQPYPDSSSEFLISLASYKTLPTPTRFPCLSVIGILLFEHFPRYAVALLNGLGALLAALTCTAVYQITFTLTRFFCINISDTSFFTNLNVHKENNLIAILVSTLSTILFATSSIMFTIGTRIYPFSFTLTLLMWGLVYCTAFRWRVEMVQQSEAMPSLYERVSLFLSMMCISFASLSSLNALFVGVPLFLYAIFPIFRNNAQFLKCTAPFIIMGIIAGSTLWFATRLMHFHLLGYHENVIVQIFTHLKTHFNQEIASYFTTTGSIGMIYLTLLLTLLTGVFPATYFSPLRPILGQLLIILTNLSIFIATPTHFWQEAYHHPTLLHASIILLMAITLSTLIGAWIKNGLDHLHTHGQQPRHPYFFGLLFAVVLACTLPYAITNRNHGTQHQQASTAEQVIFASALTFLNILDNPTIWQDPSPAWNAYRLTQLAHNHPISHISLYTLPPPNMRLPNGTFSKACAQDSTLAKLAQTSIPATWHYLMTHEPYAASFLIDKSLPIAFSAIPTEPNTLHLTLKQAIRPRLEQERRLSTLVDQVKQLETTPTSRQRKALIAIISTAINRLTCQAINENKITPELCTLMRFAYEYDTSNCAYQVNYYTLLTHIHSEIPPTLAHKVMQFHEDNPEIMSHLGTPLLAVESTHGALNQNVTQGWEVLPPLRYGEATQIIPAILKRIQCDPLPPYADTLLALIKDTLPDAQVTTDLLPIAHKVLTQDPHNIHARTLLIDTMCCTPFTDHTTRIQRFSLNEQDDDSVISLLQHLAKIQRNDASIQRRILGTYLRTTDPLVAKLYIQLLILDKKWHEAINFIDQYTTVAHLKQTPLIFSKLRTQILNAAHTTEERTAAFHTAKRWVINTPYQHRIWTYIFNHYPKGQDAIKQQDIKICLDLYPAHPMALKALLQE